MYILDDIDRLILAHLAAVGIPQATAQIYDALQNRTPPPSYHQVRDRVRGLHAARGLTCEAHTSPHVRGITHTYTLPSVAPGMSEAQCIAAIRARVARFRATA